MKLIINTNTEQMENMKYLDAYTILINIKEAKSEGDKIILEGEDRTKLWSYFEKELNFIAYMTASFYEEDKDFVNIENEIYDEVAKIFKLVIEED